MHKLALLAGIGAALMATPAFADVSDLSTLYLIEAGGAGGGDITTSGSFSASGKTASGGPTRNGPEVSAMGSGTQTGSSADDSATAESSWDVQIEGPAPDTVLFVPILITGSYSATASGTGTAFAGIGTGLAAGLHGTVGFVPGGEFGCGPGDPSGCGSSAFTLSASVDDSPLSGGIFSIFIQATGNLDGSFPGPLGAFSAFVDPHVSIDCAKATFADCSAYSLVVAPDSFTVGSGVPEPGVWALMLIGFAGLGVVGYRRAKSGIVIAL